MTIGSETQLERRLERKAAHRITLQVNHLPNENELRDVCACASDSDARLSGWN